MSGMHFGDYAADYLALAYGVDPNTAPLIDAFKQERDLKSSP